MPAEAMDSVKPTSVRKAGKSRKSGEGSARIFAKSIDSLNHVGVPKFKTGEKKSCHSKCKDENSDTFSNDTDNMNVLKAESDKLLKIESEIGFADVGSSSISSRSEGESSVNNFSSSRKMESLSSQNSYDLPLKNKKERLNFSRVNSDFSTFDNVETSHDSKNVGEDFAKNDDCKISCESELFITSETNQHKLVKDIKASTKEISKESLKTSRMEGRSKSINKYQNHYDSHKDRRNGGSDKHFNNHKTVGFERRGQGHFTRQNSVYRNRTYGKQNIKPNCDYPPNFKSVPMIQEEDWMTDLIDIADLCERNCQETCAFGVNINLDQIGITDEQKTGTSVSVFGENSLNGACVDHKANRLYTIMEECDDKHSCSSQLTVADEVAVSGTEDWSNDLVSDVLIWSSKSHNLDNFSETDNSSNVYRIDVEARIDNVAMYENEMICGKSISEANREDQVVPSNNLVGNSCLNKLFDQTFLDENSNNLSINIERDHVYFCDQIEQGLMHQVDGNSEIFAVTDSIGLCVDDDIKSKEMFKLNEKCSCSVKDIVIDSKDKYVKQEKCYDVNLANGGNLKQIESDFGELGFEDFKVANRDENLSVEMINENEKMTFGSYCQRISDWITFGDGSKRERNKTIFGNGIEIGSDKVTFGDGTKEGDRMMYEDGSNRESDLKTSYGEDNKGELHVDDSNRESDRITHGDDSIKEGDRITYGDDSKKEGDRITHRDFTYRDGSKREGDRITHRDDSTAEGDRITYGDGSKREGDRITHTDDSKGEYDRITTADDTKGECDFEVFDYNLVNRNIDDIETVASYLDLRNCHEAMKRKRVQEDLNIKMSIIAECNSENEDKSYKVDIKNKQVTCLSVSDSKDVGFYLIDEAEHSELRSEGPEQDQQIDLDKFYGKKRDFILSEGLGKDQQKGRCELSEEKVEFNVPLVGGDSIVNSNLCVCESVSADNNEDVKSDDLVLQSNHEKRGGIQENHSVNDVSVQEDDNTSREIQPLVQENVDSNKSTTLKHGKIKKKRKSKEIKQKTLCKIPCFLQSVVDNGKKQELSDTSSTTDSQLKDSEGKVNASYQRMIKGKQKALKKERSCKNAEKKSDSGCKSKKKDGENSKVEKGGTAPPSLFIDLMNVLQISGEVSKSKTESSAEFDDCEISSNLMRPVFQSSPKPQICILQSKTAKENWELETYPSKICTLEHNDANISFASSYSENNDTANTTGSEKFFSCEDTKDSGLISDTDNVTYHGLKETKVISSPLLKGKSRGSSFAFNNSWEEKLMTLCSNRTDVGNRTYSRKFRGGMGRGILGSKQYSSIKRNTELGSDELLGIHESNSYTSNLFDAVSTHDSNSTYPTKSLSDSDVIFDRSTRFTGERKISDLDEFSSNEKFGSKISEEENWERSFIDVRQDVQVSDQVEEIGENLENVRCVNDREQIPEEQEGNEDNKIVRDEMINNETSSEDVKSGDSCCSPMLENTLSEVLTISDYEISIDDEGFIVDSHSKTGKGTPGENLLNINNDHDCKFVDGQIGYENERNDKSNICENESGPFYPWSGFMYGYRECSKELSESLEVNAPQSEEKLKYGESPPGNSKPAGLKCRQTLDEDQVFAKNSFPTDRNTQNNDGPAFGKCPEDNCVCSPYDVHFWTWRTCSCHVGQRPLLCDIRAAWLLPPLTPFMYCGLAKGTMFGQEQHERRMNRESNDLSLYTGTHQHSANGQRSPANRTDIDTMYNHNLTPPPKQSLPTTGQQIVQPWMTSPTPRLTTLMLPQRPPPPPPSKELWWRMQSFTRFPPPSPKQISPSASQAPPGFLDSSNQPCTHNACSSLPLNNLETSPVATRRPMYPPLCHIPYGTPPSRLARMSSPYTYPRIPNTQQHDSASFVAKTEMQRVSPVTESLDAACLSPRDKMESKETLEMGESKSDTQQDSIESKTKQVCNQQSENMVDKLIIRHEDSEKWKCPFPKIVDYGFSENDDSDEGKKNFSNPEHSEVASGKKYIFEEDNLLQEKRRKLDEDVMADTGVTSNVREQFNIFEKENKVSLRNRRSSDSQLLILGKEKWQESWKTESEKVPAYVPPFRRKILQLVESDSSESSSSLKQKSSTLSHVRKIASKGRGQRLIDDYNINESVDADEEDSSDVSFSLASQESTDDSSRLKVKSQPSTPLNNNPPSMPFWASYNSPEMSPLYGYPPPCFYPPYPVYQYNYYSPTDNTGYSSKTSKVTPEQPKNFSRAVSDSQLHKTVSSCKENLLNKKKSESLTPPLPPRLHFLKGLQTTDTDSESLSSFSQTDWKLRFKNKCRSYGVKFIDSHCHIDFLLNRESFQGSWSKYLLVNEDTVPDNYEGCVAVFCSPSSFRPDIGNELNSMRWVMCNVDARDVRWSTREEWEDLRGLWPKLPEAVGAIDGGLWRDVAKENNVWLAMGCHPKSATEFTPHAEEGLRRCLKHEKIVALGEIGLDYSGTFKQHEDIQKNVFRKQIQIALDYNKPLVIHCRDAEDECLEILEEMVPKNYKIHCHCFMGNYASAQRWMNLFPNLYIGLTPVVTFRSALPSQEVARFIPLERLLLETDAPYFIPRLVPKNEMKYSHPGMAITVAEAVAWRKKCTVAEVLTACRQNTRNMYGV